MSVSVGWFGFVVLGSRFLQGLFLEWAKVSKLRLQMYETHSERAQPVPGLQITILLLLEVCLIART